jgi:hypothetical protein
MRTDHSSASSRTVRMHRVILERLLGRQPGEVSHKNRDRLDNRRSNLREATASERAQAGTKHTATTSRFRGVSFSRSKGKWVARISVQSRRIYLGAFRNEEDAALAYNQAALRYYGKDAGLNDVRKPATRSEAPQRTAPVTVSNGGRHVVG